MSALLLTVLLMLQGIPVQPQQGGTVIGILRTADGKPAAGIRIAAVPQTDSVDATATGPTLSSIAETDAEGRYKLENIPPGRYYVAAGRLDIPTYYPGTQSMAVGQSLQVTPGATIQGIDFTLQQTSLGRAEAVPFLVTLLNLPLDVRVEGGGKLPLSAGGKLTTILLTPTSGSVPTLSVPVNVGNVTLPPPVTDYRIDVAGLPDGYRVKSIKYGSADLPGGVLKIPGGIPGGPGTGVWSSVTVAGILNIPTGRTPAPPLQVLSITLDSNATSGVRISGSRVTGNVPINPIRTIYLSGIPGTIFSDGTFEFRNVPAGRHVILTLENAASKPALGASIVVGNGDLSGVQVETVPALPFNPRVPAAGSVASGGAPGVLKLPSVRGRIVDNETGMPVNAGTIFLVGDSWAPCTIDEGKFEFQRLLPGSYELEIQGTGYPTFRKPIVIDDQDVELELKGG